MKVLRLVGLGALALAIAAGGCSKSNQGTPMGRLLPGGNPLAPSTPSDSTPTQPPGMVISPVEFFGSDSTLAGRTGLSHWRLGNNNDQRFTMHWSLACEANWPGFPIEGTMPLQARSIVPLDIPIPVPASATDGMVSLEITVDDPAGGIFTRPGWIRVHGNPGPPPPPVIQPAVSVGFDSTTAGQTGTTHWLLGNDSDQPFTMRWTVTSDAGWPGFPEQGTVDLAPLGTQLIAVPTPVPAGTAPGTYGLTMTVTRPGGLDYTTAGVIRVWR